MPKKGPSGKKVYNPLLIVQIRGLYESGQFGSLAELHKYCVANLKKCPSLDLLKQECSKNGWNKERAVEKKKEIISKSYAELFADAGMGDVEVVQKIVDGISGPDRIVKKIADLIKKASSGAVETAEGLDLLQEGLVKLVGDLMAEFRSAATYLDQRHKLVGAYAPTKQKITGARGAGGKLEDDDLKDMDVDDITEELARLEAEKNARNK